jgi:hypothetical protein
MTAPTMIRLGELRTRSQGYYEAGEQAASTAIHYIEGVSLRLDADGVDTPLVPGFVYRVAPNDGWAVDPVIPAVHSDTTHWAHLVDTAGATAATLPLVDGAVVLDRSVSYEIRSESGAWMVFQA